MQTFLPYGSFVNSAPCLDKTRLGKQRVEAKQILDVLLGHTTAWSNHPCVRMWARYSMALRLYGMVICDEWISRGCNDSLLREFRDGYDPDKLVYPPWLGDNRLHSSHRAALLAKKPQWYGRYQWTEEPKIDYYWPMGGE